MTWRIVEEKQTLGIPFGQPLKDIHHLIDLREKLVEAKPAITILPGFEKNTHIPIDNLM